MENAGSNSKLIWLIIAIIAIGALIGACFLFMKTNPSEETNTTVNQQAVNNETVNTNSDINKNSDSSENVNSNQSAATNASSNTNSATTEHVNPLMPPLAETIVTASSTLSGGSVYDYSPKQVIDQDFSTSWAEGIEGNGIGEWIKMQFPAAGRINTLGIVPGFAKNTNLYQENNRIKTAGLEFSDGTTITSELTDQYGLHFIEFPTKNTSYIRLTIKDIYAGTKYTDSPVAELDIWSDYVLKKDAAAALAYYEKYKKPAETKPAIKYISKIYMAIGIMGSPTPEIPVNFYSPITEPFVTAAEIPVSTPAGIIFTVKWYNEGHLYKTEKITSYKAYEGINTITLSSASYIRDLSGPGAIAWPLGDFKVEWYEDNLLSKSLLFAVTPE